MLTQPHGYKCAIIINEFGEVGIDGQLVIGADEEVVELNNGCLCCRVRGDLVKIGIEAPASVRIVRGELNEFGDIAGASDLTCAADLADLHDDDSDDEHLHDELALAMHSAYDLEMVMQH